MNNNQVDILVNPEIVLKKNFDFNSVSVDNVKLKSSFTLVDLRNVISIVFKDHKVIYDNFSTEATKFNYYDGWIHFKSGLLFGIKDQCIDSIALREKSIEKLKHMTEKDIKKLLGKPDKLLSKPALLFEPSGDFVPMTKILVYQEKRLHFFINPKLFRCNIVEIRVGDITKMGYKNRKWWHRFYST